MRKSRYTDQQIVNILKQNEAGASVPDLSREHDMSSAQFYKWRAKFDGMDASLKSQICIDRIQSSPGEDFTGVYALFEDSGLYIFNGNM